MLGAVVASVAWKGLRLAPRPPDVGEAAPTFSLADVSGREQPLEQWRGRPVIVVFWAPWSAPAAAMAASLARAATALPGDAVVVSVALDYVDTAEVGALVGASTARCAHLLGRPTDLEPWGAFPVLPAIWVIDGAGIVRARHEGFVDERGLGALLR